MSRKLITLKPLTPFFFGGENTFGDGKVNYYARSNYLPQQTTILGMLRYELLLQNDLIGTDPITNDWKSIIGENSFGRINGEFVNEFGFIETISPLFLSNGVDHFTTQSLDWAYYEVDNLVKVNTCSIKSKKVAPVIVDFEKTKNEFTVYDEQDLYIPKLLVNNKSYDPKFGLVSLWVKNDGKILKQWDYVKPEDFDKTQGFENGFFIKHEQVGINRKLKKERSEKGDFYKQVYYKLADDFCFAFFVDLNLPSGKVLESRIMTMGGERSVFEMKVNDTPTDSFDSIFDKRTFSYSNIRKHKAVVLTSNCFCSDSIIEECLFSINDNVNFQNIITHQKTVKNYAKLSEDNITKSGEKLSLLVRGSVLFPKDGRLEEVKQALNNEAFSKIGYNKFIEIN